MLSAVCPARIAARGEVMLGATQQKIPATFEARGIRVGIMAVARLTVLILRSHAELAMIMVQSINAIISNALPARNCARGSLREILSLFAVIAARAFLLQRVPQRALMAITTLPNYRDSDPEEQKLTNRITPRTLFLNSPLFYFVYGLRL